MKLFVITLLFCTSLNAYAEQPLEQLLSQLTNEQKAAQMLLVYYTTPEYALEHEFGGVLLMKRAFDDPIRLKKDLQQLKQKSSINPFIAIDHEGGRVNRLKDIPGWESTLSADELGRLPHETVQQHIREAALYLSDIGVNMNLAPVLDPAMNESGKPTWMGFNQRSFGKSAKDIVPVATTIISTYKQQGIQSIVKHYPGYTATGDSDRQSIQVETSQEMLDESHYVFKKMAGLSAGFLMANITYSAVSQRPAVIEKTITKKARQLSSEGLLVTDDLWAPGIRHWAKTAASTPNQELLSVTREAIEAGNDVLMVTWPEKAVLMKQEIAKWMAEDAEFEQQLNKAVLRILANKQRANVIARDRQ